MSEEKKYTAQEAAIAVLKKAEEVLKKSELLKASGKHADNHAYNFDDNESLKGVNKVFPKVKRDSDGKATGVQHGSSEAGTIKRDAKKLHEKTLGELKTMPKPNLPKSEEAQEAQASDKAFEVKPESAKSSDDARLSETQSPSENPKEEAGAPGNNEEWGTAPKTYSTLKLAKFMGRMEQKRSSKIKKD